MHPAALPEDELLRDCQVTTGRRSGPGGQHRNKVETAVVIQHTPSRIKAEATERRSQIKNKLTAIFRLRVRLALEIRTSRPAEGTPSECWKSRVRAQRVAVNGSHEDFPALLAEVLDVVAEGEFDIRAAAERLLVSSSQLIKFLKIEHNALAYVNQQRAERGLGPLR